MKNSVFSFEKGLLFYEGLLSEKVKISKGSSSAEFIAFL